MKLTLDEGVIDPMCDSRYLIASDKLLAQLELNASSMELDELRGKEKDVMGKGNSFKGRLV